MNSINYRGLLNFLLTSGSSALAVVTLLGAFGGNAHGAAIDYPQSASEQPERIVDCLLPGRIHSLGGRIYQTPPRPDRVPAIECEIRGGDFLVYDRANIDVSLAWWVEQANSGDPDAMRYIGEIFERGLGGEPDFVAAATWYKKAADEGNVPAKISLAQLYKTGRGVPQDSAMAKQLYADAFGGGETVSFDPRSISGAGDEMATLQSQIDEQQSVINQLSLDLHQSEQRHAAATEELSLRRSQTSSESAAIQRLTNEVERAEDVKNSNAELLRVAQERSAQLEELRQQLRMKEQESERLEQLLAYSENQYQDSQQRLEQIEAQAAESQRQLEIEKAKSRARTDDGSSAAGELSVMEQAIIEQQEVIARLRRENTSNENEAARYRQMLADLEQNSVDIQALTAEVEQRDARIDQLETLAADSNSQLSAAQQELVSQREKAANAEAALIAARKNAQDIERSSAQNSEEIARVTEQATLSERNLAAQREELVRLNQEIERIQAESEQYKEQLDAMSAAEKAAAVDMVGPTIEIIDPSLLATRGLSVNTTASIITNQPQRPIVGRVVAPAGLLSLTVDNVPVEPNDRGVFKSVVNVLDPSSTINIVAIDEQGKRANKVLEFTTAVEKVENRRTIAKRARYDVAFGNYHALLIGNANYEYFQDLKTPVNDVDAIAEVLRDKYDFKTTVLHDATNKELFKVLYEDLLPNLTSEDNLLIYYAGHGDYIEEWQSYTWLPVDAQPDNPQNYFWNDDLAKYLKTMSAKQILVIADSCYSGALTRDASAKFAAGKTDAEYERWLKKWSQKAARVALTSGGMKPVLDAGGGGHSVFARAVLEVLSENGGVLPSQDLGQQVGARVSYAAEELDFKQEPEWAPINFTGHSGGDFFFVSEQ